MADAAAAQLTDPVARRRLKRRAVVASTVGTTIEAGHLMGKVGHLDVRSPFAGQVMGFLAVEGERVTSSQPIAWLRTEH